jgi:O-antigen ligase
MYAAYANPIDEDGLLYEPEERTSDIQFPPAMDLLLLVAWLVICGIGAGVILLAKSPVIGAAIIAVPTLVGMVIKPTFALCILLLVLPTGAGVGWNQALSLDRAVGIAVAVSFFLNVLLTRPGLRVRHKALWVAGGLCLWVALVSLAQPYLAMEVRRAFTQFQLVLLILIVYWILETNDGTTFRWALRSYVIGTVGSIVVAIKSGATIRAMQETRDARYAATLGRAIDANMLSALIAIAFLSALYLIARDKSFFWRLISLVALLFLPVMLIRTGSRGGLVALAFTVLSPLLFVRQVLRRPALAALMVVAVLATSVSAGFLIKQRGLESSVAERLTNLHQAQDALEFRMHAVKEAVDAVLVRPTGTGYYSWFERTGSQIWPHNDFFFALGVYGIPGALLFGAFVVLLMLTVRRTPLTLEKLYARAVLTFLLVMGLNIKQLSAKYYWVFLAFVLAAERISWWYAEPDEEEWVEDDEPDEAVAGLSY